MSVNRIELVEMIFFSHHGCFKEERVIGNKFIVDLSVDADLSKPALSDNLDDTLNYQELYNIVRDEMDRPSSLLEHVAGRILNSLKSHFPQIDNATISIKKINPPLGGQVGASRVIMSLI